MKKIISYILVILLMLSMVGCSSGNNDNSSEKTDNQATEVDSDAVNEYGIKESDMQDLYAYIKTDMIAYFKEKGIDSKTFQWPSHSEEDLEKYWIIIRSFCDEYAELIKYDDMSMEKIRKEFEEYYKDKYFQDDTQLLMYNIGVSIVRWTNEHNAIQDDIFLLPAIGWAKLLPKNINFTK